MLTLMQLRAVYGIISSGSYEGLKLVSCFNSLSSQYNLRAHEGVILTDYTGLYFHLTCDILGKNLLDTDTQNLAWHSTRISEVRYYWTRTAMSKGYAANMIYPPMGPVGESTQLVSMENNVWQTEIYRTSHVTNLAACSKKQGSSTHIPITLESPSNNQVGPQQKYPIV